jgi:hypothetical protein
MPCLYKAHLEGVVLRGSLHIPSLSCITSLFPLLNISHKIWMMLIAWNPFGLLRASNTTLSLPGLRMKSTFISANIVPPQQFGTHLHFCLKILQGHIVCVHLCLMQSQIMLPRLQAMHYDKKLIVMSWLLFLTTIEFFASICEENHSCINIHQ